MGWLQQGPQECQHYQQGIRTQTHEGRLIVDTYDTHRMIFFKTCILHSLNQGERKQTKIREGAAMQKIIALPGGQQVNGPSS